MSSILYRNLINANATEGDIEKAIELESKLNSTDYITIKIIEASFNGEDIKSHYADIINNRLTWRNELNAIQEKYGL